MPFDPARDLHFGVAPSPDSPSATAQRLLPSDTQDVASYPRALRIFVPQALVEATIVVTPMLATQDTDTVTLKVPAGLSYEPLRVRRIWATGTSPGIEIHGFLA